MTLRSWIVCLVICFSMLLMGAAQPAFAESASTTDVKTVDENGAPISCKGIPEAQGAALVGVIVPCLTYTIEKSTIRFAAGMVEALQPLFYVFLILVVAVFGAKLLQQEPNIHRQGLLMLLKLAIIGVILSDLGGTGSINMRGGSSGEIIPSVYNIMNESQQIITSAIGTTGVSCEVEKYSGPNTPRVWAMTDCVLGKLFGYTIGSDPKTGQKSTNMVLVTSVFGLITGFFFSGTWGVALFFAMLGVLFSIFMLVVRTAIAFINGYLTICLMLIIMPLFLPLILLNVTKNYFEGVWKNILAAFIMPIMITAYAMLALLVYDKALFAPDSLLQNLFKYDMIKEALEAPRKLGDRTLTNDPTIRLNSNTGAKDLPTMFKNVFLNNPMMPTLSGGNNLLPGAVSAFNYGAVGSPKYKEGQKTIAKLFEEALVLFIICWLLHRGLSSTQDIVLQLSGGGTVAATFFGSQVRGLEFQNIRNAQQVAKESYYERDKTGNVIPDKDGNPTFVSGSKFIEQTPTAVRSGVEALFKVRRQ